MEREGEESGATEQTMQPLQAGDDEAEWMDIGEIEERDARARREESGATTEQLDEFRAIGYALMTSASVLPEFCLPHGIRRCIDDADVAAMSAVHAEEYGRVVADCAYKFLTRRPLLQNSDPPKIVDCTVGVRFVSSKIMSMTPCIASA